MNKTCPLGSVVNVSAGQPAPKANELGAEGKPFIRAGSLKTLLHGGTLSNCEKVADATATRKRLRLYPKDTIVFAKSGMSATLGRVYQLAEPAYVVNHLAALVPIGMCDPTFLTYWLRRNPPSHLIKDLAYPSIRVSEIEKLQVPEFPLEEQRHVAAILDWADGIRRKPEQALVMADQLLRSAFLEMFGDPVLNTKNLPTISLGELFKVSSGNGLTAKNMHSNGVYPVYGGNGINGYHSEYMFEEPQVVIGRVGVNCGAVHLTRPKSWVTDNALYLREYRKPVNKVFLQWALKISNLNQFADRAAQPFISGSSVYPIKIVLPDKNRQSDFSRFVHRQNHLVARLTDILYQTSELFSALSQRAFRGEL